MGFWYSRGTVAHETKMLSIKEAAYVAGVSRRTIERWAARGEIRIVRIVSSARPRIPAEDVDPVARLAPRRSAGGVCAECHAHASEIDPPKVMICSRCERRPGVLRRRVRSF